ncbi:hypothetical protein DY000_02039615 [Brassica cretica]|uniref:Uncharacterized protein n=1 Tax=Brassica cretica TaxID=69181 RepID=A0ABQ7BS12_BRACR|nr:hypothetical protein DY000_02039615 [Brassica cretica]
MRIIGQELEKDRHAATKRMLRSVATNWHVSYDAPYVRVSVDGSRGWSRSFSQQEPRGRCPARGLDDFSQPVCPLFLDFILELEECALKSTGVAHSQQASPGQDIAPVILLSQILLRSRPCSILEENKFPRDRPGSNRRFHVLDLLRDDLARFRTLVAFHWMSRLIHGARGLKKIQDPGFACRWMARLVGLAGEDHLFLLKSAVGDLLPRSEAGILDFGFALE